jgi:putative cell wall-binding protein
MLRDTSGTGGTTMSDCSVVVGKLKRPRAWVVIGAPAGAEWAAAELEWVLHLDGLATARVRVDGAVDAAAADLRAVADQLALDTGCPVLYSGVAAGAAAALRAASFPGAAGALSWRGDLGRGVVPTGGPSLIIVHPDEGAAARRAAGRAKRRLAGSGRVAVLWAREDPLDAVRSWRVAASRGAWPYRSVTRRRVSRQVVVPVMAALVAGPILLPRTITRPARSEAKILAQAGRGRRVERRQRLGDGAGYELAAVTAPGSFAGKKIGAAQRDGDVKPDATGSRSLIDADGMKFFINTDITFSTSSSASAGMSEASGTHAVPASTSAGGMSNTMLEDAYDGYQSLAIYTGAQPPGPVETGNASYDIYNKNGAAPTAACDGQGLDFPIQTDGGLGVTMTREVYVSPDDDFARWLDVFTNTGASPVTFDAETANNLGSDNHTTITGTSSNDAVPSTSDDWVTTSAGFQGKTNDKPRLGHIMEGPGASLPLEGVHFANGNDNPYWSYELTIPAGQTEAILNFAVVDGTIAASKADSARLDALPATALECLTPTQESDIVNFSAAPPARSAPPYIPPSTTSTTTPASATPSVGRLAGSDRIGTAIAASQSEFSAGSTDGAVIATSDDFADALTAGPLAAKEGVPLLLNPPDALDPRVLAELQRVAEPGSSVQIVGGEAAISDAVQASITAAGFTVTRLAGSDRFATAVAVAGAMGNPTTVVEASGESLPDAVSASALAAHLGGAVLLTDGPAQATETAAYLAANPGGKHFAVGGEAAAADPSATPLAGADRFETSVDVAQQFQSPTTVGIVNGADPIDGLAAGALLGEAGGPVILIAPTGGPSEVDAYLQSVASSVKTVDVFGGTAAVPDSVVQEVQTDVTPTPS